MEKRVETNLLLDFYGALLTPHALELTRMYFEEDMSLQEIAEVRGISRQAVHDAITRSEKQLMEYEEKLGLLKRERVMRERIAECREKLAQANEALRQANEILEGIDGL